MGNLINNYISNQSIARPQLPANPPEQQNMPQVPAVSAPAPEKVSKTPDRVVNATGVVAGISGMIGGGILGGTVGTIKLPGECIKSVVMQDYAALVEDSLKAFASGIKNNPAVTRLVETVRNTKSADTGKELAAIAKTLTSRLNSAFEHDPVAKSVINKVFDPIAGIVHKGKKSILLGGLLSKNPKVLSIAKLLGHPVKTTTIVSRIISNAALKIGEVVENIQNFTPEERKAFGSVIRQIQTEFSGNDKIKVSKGVLNAVKEVFKDAAWITTPIKELQGVFGKNVRSLDFSLMKAPLKTIGLWAAAGSAVCATLSTLVWAGYKKVLMSKEKA